MSDNHGKFCWYELSTPDVEGAKGFYGELIGWSTHDVPMPTGDYAMWMKPGGQNGMGGVSVLGDEAKAMGAPPNWMLNIASRDIDGTVALAQELGAQVFLPVSSAGEFGRFAILADPQGAVFAVFQSDDPTPLPDMDPDLGGVGWRELMTSDLEGALRFYGALFGWQKTTAMDMGPMGTYQMFGVGEASYGGMMNRPPEMPVSAWLPYFNVPDADKAVARATAMGATVANPPMDVPGGRAAALVDPQGAAFAVFSLNANA
jgi:predicted enzyme related to lactoylglutathione lyase